MRRLLKLVAVAGGLTLGALAARAACPERPQNVLVLDLKSGWWAGDADPFYDNLLTRVVTDCPTINVEFHYVEMDDYGTSALFPEQPGFTNGEEFDATHFPRRTWGDYQQIWILSGSYLDDVDLQAGSERLEQILRGIADTQASIFIGAGLGSLDHANAALAALQMPEAFRTHQTDLRLSTGSVDHVVSYLEVGTHFTAPHPLFAGVQRVVDTVDMGDGEGDLASDYLEFVPGGVITVAATDTAGEPAIATAIGPNDRRVVLDAGLPRIYTVLEPAQRVDTYTYLMNVFNYLAR